MDITKLRAITTEKSTKKAFWLVLTGGPSGGKSSALEHIVKALKDKNYKIFFVDETATNTINSGIIFKEYDVKVFQDYIITLQIAKEAIIQDAIEKYSGDENILVICDRGLMDNKAYTPPEILNELFSEHGITEKEVLASYDAVIHLVTAADGAEEHYTLENNKARSETPEEARRLDKATLEAWKDHPVHIVIDNSTDFDKKLERVINNVYGLLGI